MTFPEQLNIILSEYNVPESHSLPLSECRLIYPGKLEQYGLSGVSELNVCIFTVPYLTKCEKSNISDYAKSRDYHLFFAGLWENMLPKLREQFPGFRAVGFADNSPIDEVHAAAKAGLGVIGRNGLLITPKYSSYVFIGEVITDATVGNYKYGEIKHCRDCGICTSVCPKHETGTCLSALTQKKGILSAEQQNYIKKYKSAWGCDICQECCPYTAEARKNKSIYTEVGFFQNHRIENLTSSIIREMSDEDFGQRAYAWRKRETVLRNIALIEESAVSKK